MIDKKSIIKMSEHVFRKSKGYPDRKLMHPQREWGIGVAAFIVLVIIGGISASNLFVTYRDVEGTHGDSGGSIPQYRKVIVQNALELHRLRYEEYANLRGNQAPVVVPEVASSTGTSTIELE